MVVSARQWAGCVCTEWQAAVLRSSPVIVTENDIQFSEPGPVLPLCSSLYIWTGDLDLASSNDVPCTHCVMITIRCQAHLWWRICFDGIFDKDDKSATVCVGLCHAMPSLISDTFCIIQQSLFATAMNFLLVSRKRFDNIGEMFIMF